MKVRTDFVTNSSSSSFIFGKPGCNTIKIEDVVTLIKDFNTKILNVFKQIDELVLAMNDDELIKNLQLIRSKTVYPELNLGVDTKELEDYSKLVDFEENYFRIKLDTDDKLKVMESAIDQVITENGLDLYYEDVIYSYTNKYDLERYCAIAQSEVKDNLPLQSYFIDFRTYENNNDSHVHEMINWYEEDLSKEKQKELKNSEDNKLDLLHKYFGEVALVGDCGYIPYLIVQLLYDHATFGCDHMG